MTHSSFVRQVRFAVKLIRTFSLFRLLVISTFSIPTFAGSILVQVEGIEQQTGQVICNLFNSEQSFLELPLRTQIQVVRTSKIVTIQFEKVIPETYAIACIYDKNRNGELDTNFMGIPSEAVGVSNNAKSLFGPPKYKDAKFDVMENVPELKLHINVEYVFD